MEFITFRYLVINMVTRVTFITVTCPRRSSYSSNSTRHISHIHSLLTFRSVCFMYHPTFCTWGRSRRPVVLIASGKQCTGLSDAGNDVTRHACTCICIYIYIYIYIYISNMVARSTKPFLPWKSNTNYVFWVCVCSLSYPARKAYAPYYIVICILCVSEHIIPHFFAINGTIFRKKCLLKMKSVFWFSLQLVSFLEEFLILRRTERNIK